jgi:hypothetical protein
MLCLIACLSLTTNTIDAIIYVSQTRKDTDEYSKVPNTGH